AYTGEDLRTNFRNEDMSSSQGLVFTCPPKHSNWKIALFSHMQMPRDQNIG
ncbi:hypothetical protein WA026_010375, partial [Henosepilachna vigintioctopunctata]